MVTCFLNASSRLVPAEEEGSEGLGVLLVCFLKFFGNQFDPRVTAISVSRGFFQRHTPGPFPPHASQKGFHQRRRSFRVEDLESDAGPGLVSAPTLFTAGPVEAQHKVRKLLGLVFPLCSRKGPIIINIYVENR
jgi:hypothetical protein